LKAKLQEYGVEIKHGTPGVPSKYLKNSQKILTFSKNFSHFSEGMQGQVERLNGTLKLATTKALLQALHIGAEGGSSFEEQLSTQQRWVEAMKQQVEIYNHTQKI